MLSESKCPESTNDWAWTAIPSIRSWNNKIHLNCLKQKHVFWRSKLITSACYLYELVLSQSSSFLAQTSFMTQTTENLFLPYFCIILQSSSLLHKVFYHLNISFISRQQHVHLINLLTVFDPEFTLYYKHLYFRKHFISWRSVFKLFRESYFCVVNSMALKEFPLQ